MINSKYIKGNQEKGLTPITSQWMQEIMSHPKVINELFTKFGSPLNILNPASFTQNCIKFKEVFESNEVKYGIFYARKANKAKAFVKQAFKENIGVDTASERELLQSLQLGGDGEHLVLTSAIKTKRQIEIAIQNNVPIVLDNDDECILVNNIAEKNNKKARVAFRLSGFHVEGSKLYSRFGFDIDKIEEYLINHVGEGKAYNNFKVEGLHFHLDGYSTQQRSEALLQCIKLTQRLKEHDFSFRFIDMGGGILINYLKHKEEWLDFDTRLEQSLKGEISPVTFNKNGLGYRLEDGIIKGERKTYPYFNEINSDKFLDKILKYSNQKGNSVASLLKKENIEIRIEPEDLW
ncbi:Y4yA family PLP-dependent enzyme [Zunongwangia endophytica]|uniref:Y4yA family PLP-dependent enzyme n=1 Tax=Zunongwangia endophytica TaxID=1808945 RepID=UPI0025B2EFFC|nr:Y4yA family PLP-dependent enzyme [Zunongwangia endophytica]MDN3593489.1 Y4yA family PLP-dependent enzyme [Zunongwangia endophytica]